MSRYRLLVAAALVAAAAESAQAQREKQPDDEEEETFGPDEDPAPPGEGDSADDPGADLDGDEGERDALGIPSGYRRLQIEDLTFGMRDDSFWSIDVGTDGTIYVGTLEGRSYISRDDGTTWSESTIIPEAKSLFGFAGQSIFLGKLRSDSTLRSRAVGLRIGTDFMDWHFDVMGRDYVPLGIPSGGPGGGDILSADRERDPEQSPTAISPQQGSLTRRRLAGGTAVISGVGTNALTSESLEATGDSTVVLGAALSVRAPRLALLLNARGRPIANISLQRLLITTAQRPTEVRRIIPDPGNSKHLMAATTYGLYQSYDGGTSWVRTFAGMTAAERGIFDIVFDPKNPKRVYMGTSRGLFVSNNRGDGWSKSTTVPEIQVKKIALDPNNPKNIYFAGNGGVFRTNDGGQSVALAYYWTIPRANDVFSIAIDPSDPNTGYLATGLGMFVTKKLTTSTSRDWQFLKPARLEGLVLPQVFACSRHPGHLYTFSRADLTTINYGANGPENYVLESWDGGQKWRVLASLRTAGDMRWFTPDPRDPDTVWVAFSRSIVRVKRVADDVEVKPALDDDPVFPGQPSMSEVLQAALRYHKLDVDTYQKRLNKLRKANWLPARLNVTFAAGRTGYGAVLDDLQFADDRFRARLDISEWSIMGVATWRLPELIWEPKSVTMMRFRELTMNDEVRNKIMLAVQRNYGELQRLKARRRAGGRRSLYVRAVERTRMEQLEAVVDLASGGYLTKRREARARKGR